MTPASCLERDYAGVFVSGASRLCQAASQVLRPRHLKSDSRKVESAEVTSCSLPSDPEAHGSPSVGLFLFPA